MTEQKWGWYSAKMAEALRQPSYQLNAFTNQWEAVTRSPLVYSTPDGGEVLVTAVTSSPEHDMGWDDVEPRGPVVAFLRMAP